MWGLQLRAAPQLSIVNSIGLEAGMNFIVLEIHER